MKLDGSAILTDDHQDIDGCVTRRRFALAREHVNIDVAIGTKTAADWATRNVFSEKELVDLRFREVTSFSGRFPFHCGGICHRNHRGLL